MNSYELEMMTDPSHGLEYKEREDRKRQREDIDNCHTKCIDSFNQKKVKGLDMTDHQNNHRFNQVSMKKRHHDIVSDSSFTTLTDDTAKEAKSSNRKHLPRSEKTIVSNRVSSVRSRRRKKAWVHELEQIVYELMNQNQKMEQKNQNLTNLLKDAENCTQDNKYMIVDTNCSNSRSVTAKATLFNNNPVNVARRNMEGTVIKTTDVLDSVVNDSLFTQQNKALCSNEQFNNTHRATHRALNYHVEQRQNPMPLLIILLLQLHSAMIIIEIGYCING